MRIPITNAAKNQVVERTEQFLRENGKDIVDLLGEVNCIHLHGKGKVMLHPVADSDILRWTLAWEQGRVSFDLNLVVHVENIKGQMQGRSVLVHRHASAPYDYNDHMPTTRMRRLNGFSIAEIKGAVEAEFHQEKLPGRNR